MEQANKAQRKDFYWLNHDSRKFLERGYLLPNVAAEDRVKEIADSAETILNKKGFSDKFFNYMAKGYISLSSPVWSNFGNTRGFPISCFSSFIDDNMESILDTVAEIGSMSKYGGGTSAYFGKIRGRGEEISNNGKSNGSFPFLKLYEVLTDTVSQGNTRRGMMAAYIDIDHKDINEWLDIHTEGNPIQQIYYGVCVSDKWLEEMKAGDKEKRKIWAKVLQRRSETGIPYLFFTDNANKNKPQVYIDKDMKIYNSNMCVSGDTTILTKNGYVRMDENVGKKFTVWNGFEWSKGVEIVKTNENQDLYRISIIEKDEDNVEVIKATEYHKFYVYDENNQVVMRRTSELKVGDRLEEWYLPHDKEKKDPIKGVVQKISLVQGKHDTYCVVEPKRHKVVFNGILTGNCNEIYLPINIDESFVCCLASLNLVNYDEWKDTDVVETLTYFLDAVLTDFINKAKHSKHFKRAVTFAERHRAIGIGVLGWHSYLQSKSIAFDSFDAMKLNNEIFKFIDDRSLAASKEMAEIYGEPEVMKGYGARHTTRMAVAPTKSSSAILGQVSPSIEPYKSNYYIKDLAKLKTVFKNPYLEELLKEKGQDVSEVWDSIMLHNGSVQHLDFLSEHEKNVFKTFEEISQLTIIQQAAQRQKYIDQGQSINITIHPKTPTKDVNMLYLTAHELGLKGLYYQFSMNAAQAFNRDLLTCSSCEA